MISTPKISVILPIFNGMPFLKEAVQSLKQQTFKDFIVLLINNGSTDRTKEFVNSINDERFIYYELKKNNLVKALNLGLQKAETEFIARMDADDISDPLRFEKQLKFLNEYKDIDIVGTQGKYISMDGWRTLNITLPQNHDDIIKNMYNSKNALIHASVMMRRESIKNKFYNENYYPCEDYDFFLRISSDTVFANLSERLFFFRVRNDSILSKNIEKSITKYYVISEKYTKTRKSLILKKIDIFSVVLYRKGLFFYLNKNSFIGLFYFFVASLINPSRLFSFIRKNLFNYKF